MAKQPDDYGVNGVCDLLLAMTVMIECAVGVGFVVAFFNRSLDLSGAVAAVGIGVFAFVAMRIVTVILRLLLAIVHSNERAARASEYAAGRRP